MIDSLDVVPASDKEPGKVFETMICRVLSKDVIQQPLKLLSDHVCFFARLVSNSHNPSSLVCSLQILLRRYRTKTWTGIKSNKHAFPGSWKCLTTLITSLTNMNI